MSSIEYGPLDPTLATARAVQGLIRSDLRDLHIPRADERANPDSQWLSFRQRAQLRDHPDEYTGASLDGKVVGYVRARDWHIEDEYAFATDSERVLWAHMIRNGATEMPRQKLGIFALMVNRRLAENVHQEIAERLLDIVTDRARFLGKGAINVAFTAHDPLRALAERNGFVFTGRRITLPQAPDIPQYLHAKPLDS